MKKVILLILLVLGLAAKSQEKLTAVPEGLIPQNIVKEYSGKSANEIYKSVIKWVNIRFKNPNSVIKADLPGELVRIRGVWNVTSSYLGGTEVMTYFTMNIEIKDGKIRYSIYDLRGTDDFNYENCFKKDGSRRTFMGADKLLISIENHAENFVNSLDDQILIKQDNW